jgi:hypothetical protein
MFNAQTYPTEPNKLNSHSVILRQIAMTHRPTHVSIERLHIMSEKSRQPFREKNVLFLNISALKARNKHVAIFRVGNIYHAQEFTISLLFSCFMQPGEYFLEWCFKCTTESLFHFL